jgi:hypothetical protein
MRGDGHDPRTPHASEWAVTCNGKGEDVSGT